MGIFSLRLGYIVLLVFLCTFSFSVAHADTLSLTSGSNATTTPNVATAITGFQIVGPSGDTTPVKLRATHGTMSLSTVSGVTMTGNGSNTVNLSGTVANLNTALSTLKYTRSSTGTDTLEVSLVSPTEVFFEDNGHLYQFISGGYTWSSAKTAAEGLSAYGSAGYLATITSSAENNFVYARITGNGWIGATDIDVERTWRWVTGPEAGTHFFQQVGFSGGNAVDELYNAWYSGEPNDYNNGSPGEDCAHMYSSGGQAGTWNDFPCSSSLGYVVEFGADGDLPEVVATNISIVTADVPAVTSFSPTNGTTTAATTTNLVIGFSKSVTADSGNILIKKVSDDSTFETIAVSSGLVTGGGTNSITINPAGLLAEGVQYYVVVPNTAFKDSSNNYFEGFSASTTWAFRTSDATAPVISNVAVDSVANTSATITWDTNEEASTKVVYSIDETYASSTSETDTSTRVVEHTKNITNLVACTTYLFKVVSGDVARNYATSTRSMFTTSGCESYSTPLSATTTAVAVNTETTSTHSQDGRTITVTTPENFTNASTTVVIQIRSVDASAALAQISTPTNLETGSDIVFDVTALINDTLVLDSFDHPVTISYSYTDEDITGLDESTLWMYHYHDNAWEALDDCTVDVNANTITCTTESFSIFGVFGSLMQGSTRSRSGTSVQARVKNLISTGNQERADEIVAEYAHLFPTENVTAVSQTVPVVVVDNIKTGCVLGEINRVLRAGSEGEDVRSLQKFLNCTGFLLGTTGPGSPGNETTLFSVRTYLALVKFQEHYFTDILVPTSLTQGSGIFGEFSKKKALQLSGN